MALSTTIYDQNHKKVSAVELPESMFGKPSKLSLVHEVVKQSLANRRVGTHATKTKGLVRGGGKKPFRQKGTGNARQGSSRSPLLVGGGTTFGPHPRDYGFNLPKKKRWVALCVVLSHRTKEGRFHVVDELGIKDGKTKSLLKVLGNFSVKNAVVVDSKNDLLRRAARNIHHVKYVDVEGINVYDIVGHDDIVMTKGAFEKLLQREKTL